MEREEAERLKRRKVDDQWQAGTFEGKKTKFIEH